MISKYNLRQKRILLLEAFCAMHTTFELEKQTIASWKGKHYPPTIILQNYEQGKRNIFLDIKADLHSELKKSVFKVWSQKTCSCCA